MNVIASADAKPTKRSFDFVDDFDWIIMNRTLITSNLPMKETVMHVLS